MSRVFLDANVLFGAAISSGGSARAIFEVADQYDGIALVVTEYVMEEALTNLEDKRAAGVPELLMLLDGIGFVPEPPDELTEALQDRCRLRTTCLSWMAPYTPARTSWSRATVDTFGKLYGRTSGDCTMVPLTNTLEALPEEVTG